MAISQCSRPSHLENITRAVAFEPDLQRVFLYGVTDFLPHSTTAELLPSSTYVKSLIRASKSRYGDKKSLSASYML